MDRSIVIKNVIKNKNGLDLIADVIHSDIVFIGEDKDIEEIGDIRVVVVDKYLSVFIYLKYKQSSYLPYVADGYDSLIFELNDDGNGNEIVKDRRARGIIIECRNTIFSSIFRRNAENKGDKLVCVYNSDEEAIYSITDSKSKIYVVDKELGCFSAGMLESVNKEISKYTNIGYKNRKEIKNLKLAIKEGLSSIINEDNVSKFSCKIDSTMTKVLELILSHTRIDKDYYEL